MQFHFFNRSLILRKNVFRFANRIIELQSVGEKGVKDVDALRWHCALVRAEPKSDTERLNDSNRASDTRQSNSEITQIRPTPGHNESATMSVQLRPESDSSVEQQNALARRRSQEHRAQPAHSNSIDVSNVNRH